MKKRKNNMEQKLKDFINKWINKGGVGNTPENKGQCVGLVCVWVDELGLDHIWGNAKDLWKNYNPNQFDFVLNTADAYPLAGDIVVWNENMGGGYGHTAIATGVHQTEGKATDWFEAFSQNDPVGSFCILKKYSYNNVIGFIRPKKELVKLDDYYLGIDLNNKESVKVCVQTWKDVVDGKFIKKEEYEKVVAELDELKKNQLSAEALLYEKNTLAVKLQECEKQRDIYKAEYNNATKEGGYIEQIKYLEEAKKKQADEISELTRQVNYWQTKYNSIKKSRLKFIQHAVILLCEKAGIDLSKI
jgi:CHAP domain.